MAIQQCLALEHKERKMPIIQLVGAQQRDEVYIRKAANPSRRQIMPAAAGERGAYG